MDLNKNKLKNVLGREPEVVSTSLDAKSIKVDDRLQNRRPREVIGRDADKEFKRHVKSLVIAIKRDKQQEPVLVVWDGETYWLIDGHHRLTAISKLRRKVKATVIKASFEEARDIVLNCINRDVKVTLDGAERTALAFEAFIADTRHGVGLRDMPERAAADDLGVSRATVQRFKRVIVALHKSTSYSMDKKIAPEMLELSQRFKHWGWNVVDREHGCLFARCEMAKMSWRGLARSIEFDIPCSYPSEQVNTLCEDIEEKLKEAFGLCETQDDIKRLGKAVRATADACKTVASKYPVSDAYAMDDF